MADHAELVAELAAIEKMPTSERLKHAKKKRAQQLKKYQQYEKQLEKDAGKKARKSLVIAGDRASASGVKLSARVRFVSNVILLEAAGRNDIEEVRRLLSNGVSANVSNDDGLTALHQCCIDDSESMLRLLIQFGADVNARDSELWTPLHAAATCGHVHLCKYLIEKDADLLAVNADGNMPYDICEDEVTLDYIESEMAKRGVTQELIDFTRLSRETTMLMELRKLAETGGDLEYRGRNGETPLHISAANGYVQVAEFLLGQHVSVDSTDNDTWQPIHCAACWGQLPVLEMLLENGASLDVKTRMGDTPVDVCEDVELKQRMLEMKEEIENSRVNKSRELSRKRSVNIRSASVRRTSMREKKAISWKEAREEALRLRESSPQNDDDEDEAGTAAREDIRNSLALPDLAATSSNNNSVMKENGSSRRQQQSNSNRARNEQAITNTLAPPSYAEPMEASSKVSTKRYLLNPRNDPDCNNDAARHSNPSDELDGHTTVTVANTISSKDIKASSQPTGGTLSELKKQRSDGKQPPHESPKLLGQDNEKKRSESAEGSKAESRNGTLVDNNSAVIFRRSGEDGHVQLPRGSTAISNGDASRGGLRKCCVIV